MITFLCELKSVSQTKKVSLDNEYMIKFVTDDSEVLDLGKLPSDTLFKVSVEVSNEN